MLLLRVGMLLSSPDLAHAMCAGWCDAAMCSTNWKCVACDICQPAAPPVPPATPVPPQPPLPPHSPPEPSHPPAFINPFREHSAWYIDGARQAALSAAVEGPEGMTRVPSSSDRATLLATYREPTAVWIDKVASIATARAALEAAASHSPPPLVTLVVCACAGVSTTPSATVQLLWHSRSHPTDRNSPARRQSSKSRLRGSLIRRRVLLRCHAKRRTL